MTEVGIAQTSAATGGCGLLQPAEAVGRKQLLPSLFMGTQATPSPAQHIRAGDFPGMAGRAAKRVAGGLTKAFAAQAFTAAPTGGLLKSCQADVLQSLLLGLFWTVS